MKRTNSLIALCSLCTVVGAGAAEVPKKAPLTRYAQLWTNSPFTTRPAVEGPTEEKNPFEGKALRGIAPLSQGRYLITLVDKKNPAETTVIDTELSAEYEVLNIERDPEKALGTVVTLKQGDQTGTVAYDEKLSTLKPPPKPGNHGQRQDQGAGQAPVPPGGPQPNTQPGPPQKQRVMPPTPTPVVAPTAAPQTPTPTAPPTNSRFQPGGGSRFQPGGRGSSSQSGRGSRRPGG